MTFPNEFIQRVLQAHPYAPDCVAEIGGKAIDLRGKLPAENKKGEYYYAISIDPLNLYFYKSHCLLRDFPAKNCKGANPMTPDEINYTFKTIRHYMDSKYHHIVDMVEQVYNQQKSKAQIDKTPRVVSTPKHNNRQAEERKAQQRDKQLNKYQSIAPVVVTDTNGKPQSICAKVNEQYYYVSLDTKEPRFWALNMRGATPMTDEQFLSFFTYSVESAKAGDIVIQLAPLYGKFKHINPKRPNANYAGMLLSQVRQHLVKNLMTFTPSERNMCILANAQHTR